MIDHVAVAVPAFEPAAQRWEHDLGGVTVGWFHARGAFRSRQYRYANDAKLELLVPSDAPGGGDGFLPRFLARFGSRIHHVTLKTPDLLRAIAALEEAGLDVVDVDLTDEHWKEAFLRPSQVGGLIVQVAWEGRGDEEWAAIRGYEIPPSPPDAATLFGPLVRHPDLAAAAALWTTLGAAVHRDDGGLLCRWGDAPLTVRIEEGAPAGPVGLRMDGAPALDADEDLGAAVLPTPAP